MKKKVNITMQVTYEVTKECEVDSVLGTDDNALIKVSYKGNMIPDYATEDCLERVD